MIGHLHKLIKNLKDTYYCSCRESLRERRAKGKNPIQNKIILEMLKKGGDTYLIGNILGQ